MTSRLNWHLFGHSALLDLGGNRKFETFSVWAAFDRYAMRCLCPFGLKCAYVDESIFFLLSQILPISTTLNMGRVFQPYIHQYRPGMVSLQNVLEFLPVNVLHIELNVNFPKANFQKEVEYLEKGHDIFFKIVHKFIHKLSTLSTSCP